MQALAFEKVALATPPSRTPPSASPQGTGICGDPQTEDHLPSGQGSWPGTVQGEGSPVWMMVAAQLPSQGGATAPITAPWPERCPTSAPPQPEQCPASLLPRQPESAPHLLPPSLSGAPRLLSPHPYPKRCPVSAPCQPERCPASTPPPHPAVGESAPLTFRGKLQN